MVPRPGAVWCLGTIGAPGAGKAARYHFDRANRLQGVGRLDESDLAELEAQLGDGQ